MSDMLENPGSVEMFDDEVVLDDEDGTVDEVVVVILPTFELSLSVLDLEDLLFVEVEVGLRMMTDCWIQDSRCVGVVVGFDA